MAHQDVLDALELRGLIVPTWGDEVRARCPAHDDSNPSLSLREAEDGKVLIICHAGCATPDIMDALGLTMQDLFDDDKEIGVPVDIPAELTLGQKLSLARGESLHNNDISAEYIYESEDGSPLIRVQRTYGKKFSQQRWERGAWVHRLQDTRRVLYHLPAVLKAIAQNETVYLVEGEKDSDSLSAIGVCATTCIGGAGKWMEEWSESLRGANVVMIPDNDVPGDKHAVLVSQSLKPYVQSFQLKYAAKGKDISDHLEAGFTLSDLLDSPVVESDWDDWDSVAQGIDWLWENHIARGTLVWAYGPAEAGKSMCLMGIAVNLTRAGETVALYGEEMSREVEADRIARFAPDRKFFRWKNGRGLDLSDENSLSEVIRENRGTALIIFDSYERVWGDANGNENRRAVEFANMAHRITLETGATVVVIDHTGFAFRDDSGGFHEQIEPRGASAKRQQADTAILFTARGPYIPGQPYLFRIRNTKPGRLGNPFIKDLEVIDMPNGGLVVQETVSGYVNEPAPDVGPSQAQVDGSVIPQDGTASDPILNPVEMTPSERMALARLQDALGDKPRRKDDRRDDRREDDRKDDEEA